MPITKHENCCQKKSCGGPQAQPSTNVTVAIGKQDAEGLEIRQTEPLKKMMFKIEGMCCASEVETLKRALMPLTRQRESVRLSFDVINAKMTIDGQDDNLPTQGEIRKAVAKTGMKAVLWAHHVKQAAV